jgi:hypothetical protein
MKDLLANLIRPFVLGAFVALAGCGGDGTGMPEESPAGSDDGLSLACEQGQYACSWSAVSPAVVSRSVALGEQAAARLKDGASTVEVAAWLEQNESLAELQYDDGLMRIRLPGGRPVWIAKASRLQPGAAAPAAPVQPKAAALKASAAAPSAAGIVRPGVGQKRALIMVPFRYEAGASSGSIFAGGVQAAASLGDTRGYAGGVTLLENATPTASDVTVDSFGTFSQYDVVYVQTHGGQLCFDLKTNQPMPCKAFVGAQPFNGTPLDLVISTATGVELLIVDDTHKRLILSADYFRSQYPGGLKNTLVFISACSSYETSLARSLEGTGSNFIG